MISNRLRRREGGREGGEGGDGEGGAGWGRGEGGGGLETLREVERRIDGDGSHGDGSRGGGGQGGAEEDDAGSGKVTYTLSSLFSLSCFELSPAVCRGGVAPSLVNLMGRAVLTGRAGEPELNIMTSTAAFVATPTGWHMGVASLEMVLLD